MNTREKLAKAADMIEAQARLIEALTQKIAELEARPSGASETPQASETSVDTLKKEAAAVLGTERAETLMRSIQGDPQQMDALRDLVKSASSQRHELGRAGKPSQHSNTQDEDPDARFDAYLKSCGK